MPAQKTSLADGDANSITEDEPAPTSVAKEPDNYPGEILCTTEAKFDVRESVWFYRAANLGGAAGVAALRPQCREGVMIEFVAIGWRVPALQCACGG